MGKISRQIIILILLTVLCLPIFAQKKVFDDTEYPVFVVLPYDSQKDSWLFKNATPTDLTEKDLAVIEKILHEAVEDYNKNKRQDWEKNIELSNYNRQYIPAVNENGEKEVYVWCFNDENIKRRGYWLKERFIVMDGGNKFFRVNINVTKSTYYHFMANGHA